MFGFFRNEWKRFPLTFIWTAVCLAVFAALHIGQQLGHAEVGRKLGAVRSLVIVKSGPGNAQRAILDDVTGPFDLWHGEWWRLMVNAFLHESVYHLIGNLVGLWMFGRLLESRIRRSEYVLYFLSAAIGSMAIEFAIGNSSIGISGALLTVFGMLIVMRYHDTDLADRISEPMVGISLIAIIICVPLTEAGILPIANAAHFFGLGYGILLALFRHWFSRHRMLFATTVVALQAVVVGTVYCSVYPTWQANYQWYHATNAPRLSDRIAGLKKTLEINNRLPGAWIQLAAAEWKNGEPRQALTTSLTGLQINPTEPLLLTLSQELWVSWNSADGIVKREQVLKEVFGDTSNDWRKKIHQRDAVVAQAGAKSPFSVKRVVKYDANAVSSFSDLFNRNDEPASVDPEDPTSAAEGAVL